MIKECLGSYLSNLFDKSKKKEFIKAQGYARKLRPKGP